MTNIVTTTVNNNIVQKSAVQAATASTSKPTVTTAVSKPLTTDCNMASRAAACVKAMTTPKTTTTTVAPKQVTAAQPASSSTVGAYNPTVLYNVKNALYGTGSLSDSSAHVGSIATDIANALKVSPKDPNLLTAQKAMSTIGAATSANDKANALKTAQNAFMSLYNDSKGIKPTPTLIPSAPSSGSSSGGIPAGGAVAPIVGPGGTKPVTPTLTPNQPAPTPTPVISDSGKDIESNIRNSLFGKGSFETTALDYKKVNQNINTALQLVSKMPAANLVGATTQNQWQQIQTGLKNAQSAMNEALSNHGTDDTAAKQRSTSFIAAKTELTKSERLANALGYKS